MSENKLPMIIQGGMGAGVSNWVLARAVAMLGQLGVVSGTALDVIMARRLQDGDPNGDVRRALDYFPIHDVAKRIIETYFVSGGKKPEESYKPVPVQNLNPTKFLTELCVAANFVEVFLAREGHDGPVGINYLEKIQFPHLSSIYGAMLAGASVIIMGAGIPREIPSVIDQLCSHSKAVYSVHVADSMGKRSVQMNFDPEELGFKNLLPLTRPKFIPIISSEILAVILSKKTEGKIDGFIIEGPTAGGHNAPPRGILKLDSEGQPEYGKRDVVNLDVMRKLGIPFWLAGSYGSNAKLKEALQLGAEGIQVGTAFALCKESGLKKEYKDELLRLAFEGCTKVKTDPLASPTGFPFKVASVAGTLSEEEVFKARTRICDLGYLREPYIKEDGGIGYRCSAEPVDIYLQKGGKIEDTIGRKCLCNSLMSNIGMAQVRSDGSIELPLITCGDDLCNVTNFCSKENPEYSAADVIRILLG